MVLETEINGNQGSWLKCTYTVWRANSLLGQTLWSLTPIGRICTLCCWWITSCVYNCCMAYNYFTAFSKFQLSSKNTMPLSRTESDKELYSHLKIQYPPELTVCTTYRTTPSSSETRKVLNWELCTTHQQSLLVSLSITACTPDRNLTKGSWTCY